MSEDLLDRMGEKSGAGGDKLKEILDPGAGGEQARLRRKLEGLWSTGAQAAPTASLEGMQARNTAIRLAKNQKPRRADDPAVAEAKPKRKRSQRKKNG